MKSIWMQIVLLVVYGLLVFFVSRVIDLVLWLNHGMPSTQIVDPLLLSVRQLKQLLENRGVSYTGYVEKKELAQLAEAAAHIVQGEVEELGSGVSSGDAFNRDRLPVPPASSHFTGGPHFYEEVEDTKDSVWLVQVVPAESKQDEPLLDDYSWRVVCNHVAPFAIRTGMFDCRLDRRLCNMKGWNHPLLLLALPKGSRAKDKVILKTFTATRPQTIVEWVREQVSIRVNTINSVEVLKQNWLGNTTEESIAVSGPKRDVKVILFSHLLHPPLFLAALSVKFTGRIKFGMFSVKKDDSETLEKLKEMDIKVPNYIIVTPEHKIVYGKGKFEYFNFNAMNRFLRVVQPEMNDVFLVSLIFVNLLVALQTFQISVHWGKHMVRCLWNMVSYNFWLFVAWLFIIAVNRFSFVNFAAEKCLVLARFLSLTEVGSLVRTDWLDFLDHPHLVCITFFVYGAVSSWLLKLNSQQAAVHEESEDPWWDLLPGDSFWINCFFRPMTTQWRPPPPNELEIEEGIEMLIERMAVPNLWLQPVISSEYIKDLPVWKFKGWDAGSTDLTTRHKCKELNVDSPEAVQWLMDRDVPEEFHKSARSFCTCSRKSGEASHSGNSLDQKHTRSACNFTTQEKHVYMCATCGKPIDQHRKAEPNAGEGLRESESCVFPFCGVSRTANVVFGKNLCDRNQDSSSAYASEESSDEGSGLGVKPPAGMHQTSECAVCLETYTWGSVLCGLPCGHTYHQTCILLWLQRDNNNCPVCRWPAYRFKPRATQHLHRE